MKKNMLLAAGLVASICFAGCASTGGAPTSTAASTTIATSNPLQLSISPAQVAAAFCPATQNAITLITAFNATLAPTIPVAATVNTAIKDTITPLFNGACAAGATITTTNVQALIQQGLPAIAGLVAAMPLPPVTQAAIQAGFASAELLTNLVNQYENALAAAKASTDATASDASGAGAPAAASTPLAGTTLQ